MIEQMQVELKKASGRAKCRYAGCNRNPAYINDKGRIRKGTTCAKISIFGYSAFYCRECLERLHDDVRTKLNPKLWVFH